MNWPWSMLVRTVCLHMVLCDCMCVSGNVCVYLSWPGSCVPVQSSTGGLVRRPAGPVPLGLTWRTFQISEDAPSVEHTFVYVCVHVCVCISPISLKSCLLMHWLMMFSERQTDELEDEEHAIIIYYRGREEEHRHRKYRSILLLITASKKQGTFLWFVVKYWLITIVCILNNKQQKTFLWTRAMCKPQIHKHCTHKVEIFWIWINTKHGMKITRAHTICSAVFNWYFTNYCLLTNIFKHKKTEYFLYNSIWTHSLGRGWSASSH